MIEIPNPSRKPVQMGQRVFVNGNCRPWVVCGWALGFKTVLVEPVNQPTRNQPMRHSELQVMENILGGAIEKGIPLTFILTALHNVCSHGEIIGDGGPVDDDSLTKLFEGFDLSLAAAKEMEGV